MTKEMYTKIIDDLHIIVDQFNVVIEQQRQLVILLGELAKEQAVEPQSPQGPSITEERDMLEHIVNNRL